MSCSVTTLQLSDKHSGVQLQMYTEVQNIEYMYLNKHCCSVIESKGNKKQYSKREKLLIHTKSY